MHPTGGSLRVFKRFAWLEVGSAKEALPRPAHQRVTPTVRKPGVFSPLLDFEIRSYQRWGFVSDELYGFEVFQVRCLLCKGHGWSSHFASQVVLSFVARDGHVLPRSVSILAVALCLSWCVIAKRYNGDVALLAVFKSVRSRAFSRLVVFPAPALAF